VLASFPRAEVQALARSQAGAVPAPASSPLEGDRARVLDGGPAPVNSPPEKARASRKVAGGVRAPAQGAVPVQVNFPRVGDPTLA
jgi:hypothetical protein